MTADELAGLRPGDRVYVVAPGRRLEEATVFSDRLDKRGRRQVYAETAGGDPYLVTPDWHRSPADAWAVAVAASADRHAALVAEARRAGVVIPEPGRPTDERDKLREVVRYWSYCTESGIRRECPEKLPEFLEVCRELGVSRFPADPIT